MMMGGDIMHMIDCEATLLAEISRRKATTGTVARLYAMAMWADTLAKQSAGKVGELVDWFPINLALVSRWGEKGRDRTKNAAWKFLREKGGYEEVNAVTQAELAASLRAMFGITPTIKQEPANV